MPSDFWGDVLPAISDEVFESARRHTLQGWGFGGSKPWVGCDRERWIYFVQGDDGGPIKIGHTTRIDYRLNVLQAGYPFSRLRYVGLALGPPSLEGDTHKLFAHLRIRYEWFKPAAELIQHIRSLPQGGW